MKDQYLAAATEDEPTIAATEIMDRLTERLKAADSQVESMKELNAATSAVGELAQESDKPLAVVEAAKNCAGTIAQHTGTQKDSIISRLQEETKNARKKAAEIGLSLDKGYPLDRYLEDNLEVVKKTESTDHVDDTVFRWEFDDAVFVETDEGTHYEKYNFWQKLAVATDKKLQPDIVSEDVGDPEENEDEYADLSLGPKSRPWHQDHWIQCVSDLVSERKKHVEVTGPRTEVWLSVANQIGRSRPVRDVEQAVDHTRSTVKENEDGELEEIWVPTKVITQECEEYAVTPRALQQELAARGIDSDELAGERIAEAVSIGPKTVRYWRLDATHPEVPTPSEIVDEVTLSTDSVDGVEWGGADE